MSLSHKGAAKMVKAMSWQCSAFRAAMIGNDEQFYEAIGVLDTLANEIEEMEPTA